MSTYLANTKRDYFTTLKYCQKGYVHEVGKFMYVHCFYHEGQESKRLKPLMRRAKYLALRLTHLLAQTQRRCNRLELAVYPMVSNFAGVVWSELRRSCQGSDLKALGISSVLQLISRGVCWFIVSLCELVSQMLLFVDLSNRCLALS
jgi:hypothetical protein